MTATASHQESVMPAQLAPAMLLALALAALAALAVPLLIAGPGPLTSDESLYAQEAFNLANGEGYTYTTGEAVHHRAPMFPALMAADFTIAGSTIESAHWLTKAFALGLAGIALAVGWRFFGQWTGMLAGGLALASALLTLVGASLFLDGVHTFFLLLTLLLLHEALTKDSWRWSAAAGLAFGLAMLTKESALLWAPLPFVAALLRGREVGRPLVFLAAFAGAALAVAGWWWPYVYAVTGQVYLLGAPADAAKLLAVLGGIALVAAGGVAMLARRSWLVEPAPDPSPTRGGEPSPGSAGALRRWGLAGIVLVAWGGLFLYGLEQHSGWPYPNDYLSNVPAYVGGVLWTWLYPLPIIGVAWCYVAYRAAQGSRGDQLLVLGMLLFLPFALFVANRHLHVRDVLPIVALSYIALARAAIDCARASAEAISRSLLPAAGGALVVLLLLCAFVWFASQEAFRFASYQVGFDKNAVDQTNWDNPLANEASDWMRQNLPEDARVMSGRLYFSHLYMLTGGDHRWWQLPTVRVEFEDDRLVRATTLFRWEDHDMPDGRGESWLYLRQYPQKLYYVAMSERDLLDGLRAREIDYLVVTGDDAGFSSLSLLPYFVDHAAFELETSFVDDANDQIHVFRVDRSRLAPLAPTALVNAETVAALEQQLGEDEARTLLGGLSPAGYVTNSFDLIAKLGENNR